MEGLRQVPCVGLTSAVLRTGRHASINPRRRAERLRVLVVGRELGYYQRLLRFPAVRKPDLKGDSKLPSLKFRRRLSPVRSSDVFRAFALLVALLVSAPPLVAQTNDTATVRGQVLDQNKAAIAHAKVVVTNGLTGLSRDTETDGEGFYSIAGLPPTGSYKLTVTGSGFAAK